MSQTPAEIIANHFYKAHEWNGTYALEQAHKTIAALAAAGYKIMPREPTEAMLDATGFSKNHALAYREIEGNVFRAMWDAAP